MLKRRHMRKAVSTMIGGIIVLTLLLTALGTMVFVSQQYDAYQNVANNMAQFDIQRFSENIVANYPALTPPTSSTPCGSNTCYQYNMSLSNVGGLTNSGSSNGGISGGSGGGVGVRIVRIYINTTTGSSGCLPTSFCILNPVTSATSYGFRSSDSFLNPGEADHNVLFWIPESIGLLPNPNPPSPQNTIWIVTSRGRVFSFQWPFPPIGSALGGQSGAAITTGIMKIAYQKISGSGDDSSLEGTGGGYCHYESALPYPAPAGYKEKLTSSGLPGGSLTFVNPWITNTILLDAVPPSEQPITSLYLYASIVNTDTRTSYIQIKGGNLIMFVAQSTHHHDPFFIGGGLLGIYYQGTFYASVKQGGTIFPQIPQGANFYAIFQITGWNSGSDQVNPAGLAFSGTAALTNQAEDGSYFAAQVLLDGMYDRTSCTQP